MPVLACFELPWQLPPHFRFNLLEFTFEIKIGRFGLVSLILIIYSVVWFYDLVCWMFSGSGELLRMNEIQPQFSKNRLKKFTTKFRWVWDKLDIHNVSVTMLRVKSASYTLWTCSKLKEQDCTHLQLTRKFRAILNLIRYSRESLIILVSQLGYVHTADKCISSPIISWQFECDKCDFSFQMQPRSFSHDTELGTYLMFFKVTAV